MCSGNKKKVKENLVINNNFIETVCLTPRHCRKLSTINISNDSNADTLYLCLKHNQSVMSILISNPNFKCTSE